MNEDHATCKTCQETKPKSSFSPTKLSKCKKCVAQYARERRLDPDVRKEENLRKKKRRERPEEQVKIKEYRAKYYELNKDELNRKNRERQAEFPKSIKKARKKAWYEKNRERELEKSRKWYVENKEKVERYYKSEEAKAVAKAWRENKAKEDPLYKIRINLRSRIRIAFRNLWKGKRTHELVGCSWEFLKAYLEERFQEGMSWENYGLKGWHIDHIIALSTASTKEELEALCHYTNLQPLWAKENWSKGPR